VNHSAKGWEALHQSKLFHSTGLYRFILYLVQHALSNESQGYILEVNRGFSSHLTRIEFKISKSLLSETTTFNSRVSYILVVFPLIIEFKFS